MEVLDAELERIQNRFTVCSQPVASQHFDESFEELLNSASIVYLDPCKIWLWEFSLDCLVDFVTSDVRYFESWYESSLSGETGTKEFM